MRSILPWTWPGEEPAWIKAGITSLTQDAWSPWHGHDFSECLWVLDGELEHEDETGPGRFAAGGLIFLGRQCHHRFRGQARFTTLSLPSEAERALAKRYRHLGPWPWQAHCSTHGRLSEPSRRLIGEQLRQLPPDGCDRLQADAAVLALIGYWRHDAHRFQNDHRAPDWLRTALRRLATDDHLLAAGVPALRDLAHCAAATLSRTVRRSHGCTPTELVNRLRLDRAAVLLRYGPQSVLAVALQVGFNHQGHFHKLFQQRFGQTPLHYRRRQPS